MSAPSFQVNEIRFQVLPMRTRFPFKYGIASMTELPHLFVLMEASVDGKKVSSISSEGLPPKWFTKNPETKFEEDDLPEMYKAIRNAAHTAMEAGARPSLFRWWRDLYAAQDSWAKANQTPPLLAHLGTSLIERAAIDAVCRSVARSFAENVRENLFGIELGEIHSSLAGRQPSELLPPSSDKVIARHTIGLGDALISSDEADPKDGLPYTLSECIRAYGLTHFKIKVSGNLETDRDRLRTIFQLLQSESPDFQFTLDGNEQFKNPAAWWEFWEDLRADDEMAKSLDAPHLLFVEQPIHRDHAFDEAIDRPGAPPVIIDESDGELQSASRALELGYAGTSHKNCKGVIKGIANACLLQSRSLPGILSGEDLANVGPVALLQDLAVMRTLGITHVERNGHHYFQGLGMYPEAAQKAVLEKHGDLYRLHDGGFATLNIDKGELAIESVAQAPFGAGIVPDWVSLTNSSPLHTDFTAEG